MKKLTLKDFLLIASFLGHLLGARGIIPRFLAPSADDVCKQMQSIAAPSVQDLHDAGP